MTWPARIKKLESRVDEISGRVGDVEDVQLEDGARIDFHDARLAHLEAIAGIELARLDPAHPIHRLRERVAARRAERGKTK